ncbi:MAG: T9SS type A sorting domain-containing protein [Bacteroidota bacterium]
MSCRNLSLLYVCFCLVSSASANSGIQLATSISSDMKLIVVIDHTVHFQFGCLYPLTYQIDIPPGSSSLKAFEEHQLSNTAWVQLAEKTSVDTFNAIEAVRFDYVNNRAYASAAFSGVSDSLILKIVDASNNPVSISYEGISRYYDNRKAVVTTTFDDWQDWMSIEGLPIIHLFRSHGLYLTGGVITSYTSDTTWTRIQAELDSGFVEVASHSRNHIPTPYDTTIDRVQYTSVSEIGGSAQDIKTALNFPPLFSLNGTKYVYTWIAPYGDYDSVVDTLMGVYGYLDARLYDNLDTTSPREYVYGDSTLQSWDSINNHFIPFLPTVELGAPSWGGGDTSLSSLNGLFDAILAKGDVYHMMWHPQVLYTDVNKSYLVGHLNYISGRTNVWYVNLGHLYLYHLLQSGVTNGVTLVAAPHSEPNSFELMQNYPEPFNPSTAISFVLPTRSSVSLKIYDMLGREVSIVVSGELPAGHYSRQWNASAFASGVYFYRLQAGSFVQTKKLVVVK